jgi:hypothetical protein
MGDRSSSLRGHFQVQGVPSIFWHPERVHKMSGVQQTFWISGKWGLRMLHILER